MLAVKGLPVELVNPSLVSWVTISLSSHRCAMARILATNASDSGSPRVVRPPPSLDCFRRSTLPADLQAFAIAWPSDVEEVCTRPGPPPPRTGDDHVRPDGAIHCRL